MMDKSFIKTIFLCIFSTISLNAMQMEKTGFPKWDGLVDLKEAGLPTPKGVFVTPYSEKMSISGIVDLFTSEIKSDLIALRPDGKGGIGATPPGISFGKTEKSKIINKLTEWSSEGYGVTLGSVEFSF